MMNVKRKKIFKIVSICLFIAVIIGVSIIPVFAAGNVSSAIQST